MSGIVKKRRRLHSYLFAVCILLCNVAFSQDDDTIQYIHGLPESVEDTSQQIPQDFPPRDQFVEISIEQIPQELYETLTEQPLYKGWQNQVMLLDKNTGLYWLRMKTKDVVRLYGFNANGKSVSFNEITLKQNN
jgi:hypothetical protein